MYFKTSKPLSFTVDSFWLTGYIGKAWGIEVCRI